MPEIWTKVFSISSPTLPKRKSVSDLGVNTSLQKGKCIYFMSQEKGVGLGRDKTVKSETNIQLQSNFTCARITVGSVRYCILAQVRLVVLNTVFSKGHWRCQVTHDGTISHLKLTFAPSQCRHFLDHRVAIPPEIPNCTIQSTNLTSLHKKTKKKQTSHHGASFEKKVSWLSEKRSQVDMIQSLR